jgi:hypothetical protein
MIGNRAATIDGLEAGTCLAEHIPPATPMCRLCGTAQRIDRQVFKKQQDILLLSGNPFFLQLFLNGPCFGIGDRL